MRFLLIIGIVSIVFMGCKKTNEAAKNNQQENTTTTQEIPAFLEKQIAVVEMDNQEVDTILKTVKNTANTKATVKSESKMTAKGESKTSFPKIQFEQKIFDYGMIEQGEKVQYRFNFTNTGSSDLIIKNAEASCGCTMPSYPFVPIKPGETGSIGVTFSSVGKMGTQRPSITVTSNAQPKVTTLYLEGFVTDKIKKKESDGQALIINGEENVTKGGEIIKTDVPIIEENN